MFMAIIAAWISAAQFVVWRGNNSAVLSEYLFVRKIPTPVAPAGKWVMRYLMLKLQLLLLFFSEVWFVTLLVWGMFEYYLKRWIRGDADGLLIIDTNWGSGWEIAVGIGVLWKML